jgi:hypothetical protein
MLSRGALSLDRLDRSWSNSRFRSREAEARGSDGMAMTVGADAPLVGSKTEEPARAPAPDVREISIDDLTECIVAGVRDFRAEPLFGFFFGGVYAIGGWLIVAFIFTLEIP